MGAVAACWSARHRLARPRGRPRRMRRHLRPQILLGGSDVRHPGLGCPDFWRSLDLGSLDVRSLDVRSLGHVAGHLLLAGLEVRNGGLELLDLLPRAREFVRHRTLRRCRFGRWSAGGWCHTLRGVLGRSCCRSGLCVRSGWLDGRRGRLLRGLRRFFQRQQREDALRRPLRDHGLCGIAIGLPGDRSAARARCHHQRGHEGACRLPARRQPLARHVADGGGAKRRIDRRNGWPRRKLGLGGGLRKGWMAQAARQLRKLFIRGHHHGHAGGDHEDIVRIIGWLRVRRGLHGRLPARSYVTASRQPADFREMNVTPAPDFTAV